MWVTDYIRKEGLQILKVTAKTVLIAIVCVIAMFIPTYVAIGSYMMAQKSPVDEKSVTSLTIVDPNGTEYKLDAQDSEGSKAITDFIELNNRSVAQRSLPDPLKDSDYFEFRYFSYGRDNVYKYYFSRSTSDAYYVDNNGNAFKIGSADASAFLSSTYARCLYTTTAFPTMQVAGEVMNPVNAEWIYQSYGGNYISMEDLPIGELTERVYRMKGAFSISFDDQPDYLNVSISDANGEIFNDSYDKIANADIEGKLIDVVVNAEWRETDTKTCYGSATYKFKAKILLPAVFYLGEQAIEPGEFVVVSAKNVDDPATIEFRSEPDLGFEPTFFADGEYVRALVPVNCEYTGSSVKFICTYGEVTQEMTLNITPKVFKQVTANISNAIVSQTRTASTLQAFDDAMDPIIDVTSETPLWDGLFLEGATEVNKKMFLNTGFGLYRTISVTGETYRHQGVDYVGENGLDVQAVNNGKVVFVGYLDLSGYTVVIDHGWGLKSWYCHLGSTAVSLGDTVTKGDVVGYVGTTGFTATAAVHIGLAVYDVPVCPYSLWDEGIIMTNN